MKNIIGRIAFPKDIEARPASRYSIVESGGELRPLTGWEFLAPEILGVQTLLFTEEKIENAAEKAFEWFEKRGHIDYLKQLHITENENAIEYRLVGFIFPETDWAGEKIDESARCVVASKHDGANENMRFDICEVEYHRKANTMRLGALARQFYFPENGDNLTVWEKTYLKIKNACNKPALYKEDFSEISDFYLPENEQNDD